MTIRSQPDGRFISANAWINGTRTTMMSRDYRWVDSSTGTDDPGWREKVAQHKNATNSFFGSKSFVDVKPSSHYGTLETIWGPKNRPDLWHVKNGSELWPYAGVSRDYLPLSMPLTVTFSAAAIGTAVGKFNGKLNNLRTGGVQSLVFLGELRPTLAMIKKKARVLTQDVSKTKENLRRFFGNSPKRRSVKHAADAWLEYSFGWLPLMMDIRNAVANLQPEPEYRVIVGTGEDTSGGTPIFLGTGSSDPYNYLRSDVFQTDKTVSRVKCAAEVSMSLLGLTEKQGLYFRDGADSWGVTLRDFIPSAWELLPYSFLIDYFTNVGDIVAAPWVQRNAITWQYQTSVATRTLNFSIRNLVSKRDAFMWYVDVNASPGSIRYGTKTIKREPIVSVIPPFYLQYPEMGNLRWANMLALWISKTLHA